MKLIQLDSGLYFITDSLVPFKMHKERDTLGKSKITFIGTNVSENQLFIQGNKFNGNKKILVHGVPKDVLDLYPDFVEDNSSDEYVIRYIWPDEKKYPDKIRCGYSLQHDMAVTEASNDQIVKVFDKFYRDTMRPEFILLVSTGSVNERKQTFGQFLCSPEFRDIVSTGDMYISDKIVEGVYKLDAYESIDLSAFPKIGIVKRIV